MRETVAAFFVPVLTAVLLLYKVLPHLQIALMTGATLLIVGAALLVASVVGLFAALGPPLARVTLLAGCAALLLDTMLPMAPAFRVLSAQ